MSDNVTMTLETINPKKAAHYLTLNLHNRNLQPYTVALYSRLMENGDWMVNGDALRFNINGDLVDGQHRLQAVVDTGITLTTYVVRGLPVEAQLTLDQQRKRTAGDMLKMGGVSNGNRLASIVRMVERWEQGDRSMYGFSGGRAALSAKEVVDRVKLDKNGIYFEACRKASASSLMALAPARAVGTMFVLFQRADAGVAEEFFNSLERGTNLDEGDPVLTLRRYWLNLARNGRRNTATPVYLMAGVRAWNAYIEGRKITQIGYKSNIIPEILIPSEVDAQDSVVKVNDAEFQPA